VEQHLATMPPLSLLPIKPPPAESPTLTLADDEQLTI
jgi:hypothetical protein